MMRNLGKRDQENNQPPIDNSVKIQDISNDYRNQLRVETCKFVNH